MMKVKEIISLIRLHLNVLKSSDGSIRTQVDTWWLSDLKLILLTMDGWCDRVFDEAYFL